MIDYQQIGNKLFVSFIKEDGQIGLIEVPIENGEMYVWKHCEENDPYRAKDRLSCFSKPIKKVPQKYLSKYRVFEILRKLPDRVKEKIYTVQNPEKYFMDIETESINGEFPEAGKAEGRVLLNTFCDQRGNVVIQGLHTLTPTQIERIEAKINEHVNKVKFPELKKEYKIKYKAYDNETQLLADLSKAYIPKMPAIFGWNFLKYDMTYINNRCKKIGVNTDQWSPTKGHYTYTIKDKFNKKMKYYVELPKHRIVSDYQTLYEKFDTSVKLKSSSNLDDVALEVLGIQKVSYVGTPQELYEKDYETFVFYGAVDSILVALIDEKLRTYETIINLSCDGKVPLHEAFFASQIIENLYQEFFLDSRNQHFIEREFQENLNNSTYEGAYVKEPSLGVLEDVLVYDFTSEFPSIMALANVGVDSLIGRTQDKGLSYIDFSGNRHDFNLETDIWTPNGTVYTKEFDSSTRVIVDKLFGKRLEAKEAVAEIDAEIEYLKSLLS